jgi:hypothetical protein
LAAPRKEQSSSNGEHALVAAIAAAIFETITPATNGATNNGTPKETESAWKKTGRQGALRND